MIGRSIIMGFSALLLASCGGQETAEDTTPKVRPAKLVVVNAATNSRSVDFPAVIEAENSAELTFQVGGNITDLNVLEGDEVTAGQILARVEQRDYQNALAQAQAQYDNAEAEYQRAVRLAEQDAISRSVLESRETNRDIARAALDTAKKTSSDTVLRAPFSGYVSQVYVEKFQNIQAGSPIATIQSRDVVAVVNVPADLVARTPQFEPVNTRVVLDAARNTDLAATFKEAAGQADAATQTYKVSFSFTSPDNLVVLPGMTGTVSSDFEFFDDIDFVPSGIAVPLSAVVAEGEEKFVWLVDPETNAIARAPIETGMGMSENEVIVTKGLENGNLIVAAGGAYMHEGMIVRAWRAK